MRLRQNLLGIVFVFALALAASVFLFDRVIIFLFQKTYNLDVRYGGLRSDWMRRLEFEQITITDRKTGSGFSAEYAVAVPDLSKNPLEGIPIAFNLRDVRFVKTEPKEKDYGDMSGLVRAPFTSRWKYREISGVVRVIKKNFRIRDFRAESDEIKVAFTGDITHDKRIEGALVIYFNRAIWARIPEPLASMILVDDKDGWKSLSVTLSGNLASPSVNISSKLFRLKIGAPVSAN